MQDVQNNRFCCGAEGWRGVGVSSCIFIDIRGGHVVRYKSTIFWVFNPNYFSVEVVISISIDKRRGQINFECSIVFTGVGS